MRGAAKRQETGQLEQQLRAIREAPKQMEIGTRTADAFAISRRARGLYMYREGCSVHCVVISVSTNTTSTPTPNQPKATHRKNTQRKASTISIGCIFLRIRHQRIPPHPSALIRPLPQPSHLPELRQGGGRRRPAGRPSAGPWSRSSHTRRPLRSPRSFAFTARPIVVGEIIILPLGARALPAGLESPSAVRVLLR